MSCKGKGKCDKDGCHSGGLEPLCSTLRIKLLEEIEGWSISPRERRDRVMPILIKTYEFENFVDALGFVNEIGKIAELMGHHPNIQLEWGKVGVEIWTRAVDDLTMADFILAREIDYIK